MIAGTIVAGGRIGSALGVGMKRGTLVLASGGEEAEGAISPTFAFAGRMRFPFLTLYAKRLAEWGFAVPPAMFSGAFNRYNGDLANGGQGEILVATGP